MKAAPEAGKFYIGVSPTNKHESDVFTTSRRGKAYTKTTERQFDHGVNLRIIQCDSHVGLTDFQKVPKDGKYHVVKDDERGKTISKGTRIMIQPKQGCARRTWGKIKD